MRAISRLHRASLGSLFNYRQYSARILGRRLLARCSRRMENLDRNFVTAETERDALKLFLPENDGTFVPVRSIDRALACRVVTHSDGRLQSAVANARSPTETPFTPVPSNRQDRRLGARLHRTAVFAIRFLAAIRVCSALQGRRISASLRGVMLVTREAVRRRTVSFRNEALSSRTVLTTRPGVLRQVQCAAGPAWMRVRVPGHHLRLYTSFASGIVVGILMVPLFATRPSPNGSTLHVPSSASAAALPSSVGSVPTSSVPAQGAAVEPIERVRRRNGASAPEPSHVASSPSAAALPSSVGSVPTTSVPAQVAAMEDGQVRRGNDAAPREGVTVYRGELSIDSVPGGATVFVNNQPVGQTPVRLHSLPAGSRALRLELRGYAPWSRSVRVVADQSEKVSARLDPTP